MMNLLLHREDPELREIRDVDIPDLFAEILSMREENKLVIRQVRQYLTEGQNLYSQTNFAAANTLFIRAQNRWSDTNAEPNSEVEYWLELTKTALSVTTGREIAQTDPLFTEMIQYLNQATEEFNSGVAFMSKNRGPKMRTAHSTKRKGICCMCSSFSLLTRMPGY